MKLNLQRTVLKAFMTLALLLSFMGVNAQTPVAMLSQPANSYTENFTDVANWTNNFASGIGASSWASYPITTGGTANDGKRTTKSSATFVTSTSGGLQRGTQNLVFLSTGSSATSEAVAVDLLLNYTGVNAGVLSFNWAAVDNGGGTRPTSLRVYWSTDNVNFTELTAAQVIDVQSVNSGSITSIALPASFNNSATARLRFYNHAGTVTGAGNRDKISIDDVTVTGTPIPTGTPTINPSATSLTSFGTVNVGSSSASKNFTVSASDLTTDVVVAASTDYQVSLDNLSFSSGFSLTQSGGSLTGQPVTIYVRYSPTSSGLNNGTITLTSTGATTKTVTVSGTGFVPGTPVITTSVTSLTSFGNVNVGNNSLSKNFTVTATDLTTDVVVAASTDYQVSLDNLSFSSGFSLTQSGGTLVGEPVTVYVRYMPTTGGLNNGTITLTSTGATTKTVTVTGTGVVPPPTITTSVTTLPNFGTVTVGNNSSSQSFTTSASNLTANVTVTASTDYQVSLDNVSFSTGLSLSQSGGTLTGQPITIYTRFVPTSNGAIAGTITFSSTGATNKVVSVSGTGYIPTPIITPSVSSLTSFGNVDISTNSLSQNFTVSGVDLTNDVTVTASTDYQVSSDNTSFSSSLSLTQSSGTLVGQPVTVYVRFSPSSLGLNNGTITLTSTGAVTKTVTVSGTGIVPIISAPVATSATSVTSSSFVANWNTVPGATSYRLDVSTSPTFDAVVPTTDLIISEYLEGTASNKYIEIYNGTGAAVDLSDYQLRLFANGSSVVTTTNTLSGILANNSTIVYKNSAATIYPGTATNASAVNFNGDDAIAIYKISTSSFVDIFGSIGEDPGTAWTSGAFSTLDKTLVRNSNITSGVTGASTGFPTLSTQWTQLATNDVTNLGTHSYTVTAPSFVLGYDNLTVNPNSQLVSGLQENTTYYYRVRAFDGTTSINSNVISVTTLINEPTFASISQNALVCEDSLASFTITGLLPNTVSNIGYNINGGATQYFNNVSSDAIGNGLATLILSASNNGQTLTVVSVERVDLTTTILSVTSGNTTVLSVQLKSIYYADADADGYGDALTTPILSCTSVAGYVLNNTDCDDAAATTHPGAVDVCFDGIDNDCNGNIDNVGMPGGCIPVVSVLQPTQCGVTLPAINSYVYADLVAGAQGYRFKVTDLSTMQVQTIDKALRVFQLTQLSNYAFDRTYQIEVSIRKYNVWQPFYGSACTVTTPATTTAIQSAQCGSTLTAMTDVIYADNVPFSTGYRFRVINLLTSQIQIIDRPLREFRMNLLASAEYNTTYSIEVSVRNTDGTYLPYGSSCNITTPSFPTTQMQVSQCDYTAMSNAETLYADSYAGATTYRFKFENTGLGYTYVFDRPVRSFVLNTVPGLMPATGYSVQVSIEINGVFGPYGKVCTLTTPGGARPTQVEATPDTSKVIATDFKAVAYPNPFAENFKLDVTTSSEDVMQVRVYDMLGKLVEERQVKTTDLETLTVGDRYASGVYNVIVTQGENTQTVRVIKR